MTKAATTASAPLLLDEPGSPARSNACAVSSQVSTPNPTGIKVSRATASIPIVAAWQTYSKCGVPPRITTPNATNASNRPDCAAALRRDREFKGARRVDQRVLSVGVLASADCTGNQASHHLSMPLRRDDAHPQTSRIDL
jgi:hypothetical protein